MFATLPHFEFAFPADLIEPGAKHWRIVELTVNSPWFLVSLQVTDSTDPIHSFTRTIFMAWDQDLTDLLISPEATSVTAIVCLVPPWRSPTGSWWSREVREVWMQRSESWQQITLVDREGEKFDGSLLPTEPVEGIKSELLWTTPASAPTGSTKFDPAPAAT